MDNIEAFATALNEAGGNKKGYVPLGMIQDKYQELQNETEQANKT